MIQTHYAYYILYHPFLCCQGIVYRFMIPFYYFSVFSVRSVRFPPFILLCSYFTLLLFGFAGPPPYTPAATPPALPYSRPDRCISSRPSPENNSRQNIQKTRVQAIFTDFHPNYLFPDFILLSCFSLFFYTFHMLSRSIQSDTI